MLKVHKDINLVGTWYTFWEALWASQDLINLIKILDPLFVFLLSLNEDLKKPTWGHRLVNFVLTNEIVSSIPRFWKLCQNNLTIFGFPQGVKYQLMLCLYSSLVSKDLSTGATASSYDSIFVCNQKLLLLTLALLAKKTHKYSWIKFHRRLPQTGFLQILM